MFFEKNLQALALERRCQRSYQAVLACDEKSGADFELYETDAGDYTILINGISLHHPKGAQDEASALCDTPDLFHPGIRSNHLILGIGLGYLLDTVFERSAGRIFIYEPNIPLLRFVLENVDLSQHLASMRVYLSTSLPDLFAQLKSRYILGEPLDILLTHGYQVLLKEDIATLSQKMQLFVQDQGANISVGLAYHLDWLAHFFKNLPFLSQTDPFDDLLNSCAGKTALVVASGPSLDKALSTLVELASQRDQFMIIAVGGALRVLLGAGIEPDFAVFLDFEGPKAQLANLPLGTENIIFLCSPFVDTVCLQTPAKAYYRLSFENYATFAQWLDDAFCRSHHRIQSGATVSITAFECALALGCKTLILLGQDLALSGSQYYAGGVNAEIDGEGYATLSASDVMVGRKIKLMEVPGQNGVMLKTMADYFAYRQHFIELAEAINAKQATHPIALYNASVGGALIPGFRHYPLETCLEQLGLLFAKNDHAKQGVQNAKTELLLGRSRTTANPAIYAEQAQRLSQATQSFQDALLLMAEQAQSLLAHLVLYRVALSEAKGLSELAWQALIQQKGQVYRNARSVFSRQLDALPLLEYCLRKEIWALQESFEFEPKTLNDYAHNLDVDKRYFENSLALIREQLLPWLTDQSSLCGAPGSQVR